MSPPDTKQNQGPKSQTVAMNNPRVLTTKTIGQLVGPQARMSRRGESGAGRLKQESREAPLLDHINDPLKEPEIGEIIMSGSRQVQRRCNRKSKSTCSLTHSANPATDLNEVEVEKRRRLRLHKRRSLGFFKSLTKMPQYLPGPILKDNVVALPFLSESSQISLESSSGTEAFTTAPFASEASEANAEPR